MLTALDRILQSTLDRLQTVVSAYLPALLAALIILFAFWLAALAVRWVLYRIFKGWKIDKFLRQTGVAHVIDSSGRVRATPVVAETSYWIILVSGVLLGLSVFESNVTGHLVATITALLPKLALAACMYIAGSWLAAQCGRRVLVWAMNESLPHAGKFATVVRALLLFLTIVVVADFLEFAPSVFFAAFLLLFGGACLTLSVALGYGLGSELRSYFQRLREAPEEESWLRERR